MNMKKRGWKLNNFKQVKSVLLDDYHGKWEEEVDSNQGVKTKALSQTTQRRVVI